MGGDHLQSQSQSRQGTQPKSREPCQGQTRQEISEGSRKICQVHGPQKGERVEWEGQGACSKGKSVRKDSCYVRQDKKGQDKGSCSPEEEVPAAESIAKEASGNHQWEVCNGEGEAEGEARKATVKVQGGRKKTEGRTFGPCHRISVKTTCSEAA